MTAVKARRWGRVAVRLGGAALSGALVSIAIYPSWLHRATGLGLDLGPIAWVALVPLFLALRGAGIAETLAIGALWEAGALGLTTSWGGLISWPGWIAALVFFLPHHIILAFILRAATRRGSEGLVLACAAFVCHEFVRTRIPVQVPWAFLSHTQIDLPVIAVADLAGAWLVTAIIVATNYSIFLVRIRARPGWIAAGPALLALAAGYGLMRPLALDTMPGPVVGIVQGDMPAPVTLDGWPGRMATNA
ncbi:MAG: hypothetical protein JXP34_11330, partial [Planctomycetes bacterium]|nr:hypothetical protein [Planctomycetota bacterium]